MNVNASSAPMMWLVGKATTLPSNITWIFITLLAPFLSIILILQFSQS